MGGASEIEDATPYFPESNTTPAMKLSIIDAINRSGSNPIPAIPGPTRDPASGTLSLV
jgi:hypothetical protein